MPGVWTTKIYMYIRLANNSGCKEIKNREGHSIVKLKMAPL